MKIAICGITGVVGQETLGCLKEFQFEINELACYGSKRSAGTSIDSPYGKQQIKEFQLESCKDFDFVFLCVSGDFSAEHGRALANQNKCVIDSSSHFRYDDDIPLVIPEINGQLTKGAKLIANPNCTTSILAVALYPIYKEFGLKKLIVSTYQATSGGGKAAMNELLTETENYITKKKVGHKKFAHPIPFNLIPAIDIFLENGYSKEEMKVQWETHKIFDDKNIKISTTAVRIPTFRAHSESVTIETKEKIDIVKIKEILSKAPGVKLIDNPSMDRYPMPITATKQYDVEVGRVRANQVFGDYGLDFFICGDQLLKGAALNAVQIAKAVLEN